MAEENCNHKCEGCGVEGCGSRIQKLSPHKDSHIKKTIAIISGKGGVGKSMVTSLLAVSLLKAGKKVGILDADVTGPSIPRAFGKDGAPAYGDEDGIFPVPSAQGIKILSANNLLDDPKAPIIWRGSLISNLVSQMYTQCVYGELDYLLIDMPPGTGDVPLTVFQSLPIDGVVVVTSPQDLVGEVVAKSVSMAKTMNIHIYGLVENMAYTLCPHCGEKVYPFGENALEKVAKELDVPALDALPIDTTFAKLVDEGKIEELTTSPLPEATKAILGE